MKDNDLKKLMWWWKEEKWWCYEVKLWRMDLGTCVKAWMCITMAMCGCKV
jgi:hypothetical protein